MRNVADERVWGHGQVRKATQIAGLYFLKCDTFCIGPKPSPLETADFPENVLFRHATCCARIPLPACMQHMHACSDGSFGWPPPLSNMLLSSAFQCLSPARRLDGMQPREKPVAELRPGRLLLAVYGDNWSVTCHTSYCALSDAVFTMGLGRHVSHPCASYSLETDTHAQIRHRSTL